MCSWLSDEVHVSDGVEEGLDEGYKKEGIHHAVSQTACLQVEAVLRQSESLLPRVLTHSRVSRFLSIYQKIVCQKLSSDYMSG